MLVTHNYGVVMAKSYDEVVTAPVRERILPVDDEQIDAGLEKFLRMLHDCNSSKDIYDMKNYVYILVAQLRSHSYNTLAATVLDDFYDKHKEMRND